MTLLLKDSAAGIAHAAAVLRSGELVAFPTETVYGLGADAGNDRAVASVFVAKRRHRFNPLICHYASVAAAFDEVAADERAHRLAAAFWPGPLTLVLARRLGCPVSLLASAGLDTLAVRVPSHPAACALLGELGRPIAAPSANRSGHVSPTTAHHVLDDLSGRIAAVLDGGPCPLGLESTVLDLSGSEALLLRPGSTAAEAIEAVIGPVRPSTTAPGAPRSPGQLASHYAPNVPLRLHARTVREDEALLAFGPPLPGSGAVFCLSNESDVTEAAARLFAGLRCLDRAAAARGLRRIAVMEVPERGLGRAINDRLRRAAAPRGPHGQGNRI
jgi:L-threonylcarbamoyladenylate synthase